MAALNCYAHQLGYYPAAGYRVRDTGVMDYSSMYGYYWSASHAASHTERVSNLYINSGGVYPATADYRANGFSVRCVAEL
ncbi:MAG: fibrobacter succinogenes major paralogous domain-containing protein [Alistipes sp.]|nr:fibrobacter succinogenes major paralogous domain-containing protein [Alistipes sp.]MCD7968919.1 fibrobacter succinogenes major paralogous domain-containing protein [Alistipes sp.]MCD7969231.1 fibrobacter succinogenes major paralogous domain-containing protein [Alistipes sp.]